MGEKDIHKIYMKVLIEVCYWVCDSQFNHVTGRPQADTCRRTVDQSTTLVTPFGVNIFRTAEKWRTTRIIWNQCTGGI